MSLISRAAVFSRQICTSAVRKSGHDHGGYPGANLPFDVNNRYKLTLYSALFFGSAFTLPFYVLRHQLLKK